IGQARRRPVLFVEQQVQIAELRAPDVPVEILGLQIEREQIGQQPVETVDEGGLGVMVVHLARASVGLAQPQQDRPGPAPDLDNSPLRVQHRIGGQPAQQQRKARAHGATRGRGHHRTAHQRQRPPDAARRTGRLLQQTPPRG
ncbi:hypothetical protein E4T56_gene9324, partial [Termitomyces sp. T112]